MCTYYATPILDQPQPTPQMKSTQIASDINGEWELIRSKNTSNYLKTRKAGKFLDVIFLHANQSFLCKNNKFSQCQKIGNETIYKFQAALGMITCDPLTRCESRTDVDRHHQLTTLSIWRVVSYERLRDLEIRFISDGLLYIVNRLGTMKCTRIYKRVEGESQESNARQEILGDWRQICLDGFNEFCQVVPMDLEQQKLWHGAKLNFCIMEIFNEVHIKYTFKETLLEQKLAVLEEKEDGSGTFFKDGSLVTVVLDENKGRSETIRFVKNGFLFVSFHQNDFNFMAVYQKV